MVVCPERSWSDRVGGGDVYRSRSCRPTHTAMGMVTSPALTPSFTLVSLTNDLGIRYTREIHGDLCASLTEETNADAACASADSSTAALTVTAFAKVTMILTCAPAPPGRSSIPGSFPRSLAD